MTVAEVYMWGTRIGFVSQDEPLSVAEFSYDENFIKSGIEVSPIVMPLSRAKYSFPALSVESFHSLPGLVADSLPDKYGTKLIERYLAETGRSADELTPVERLLYVGKRGMGALEYVPAKGWDAGDGTSPIDINLLVELASEILSEREKLHVPDKAPDAMAQILSVGTSAGGARAKAVVAWNQKTGDIRSGQVDAGEEYEYWLIKFDGVKNNKDHEKKADGKSYTRIEYAYYLMAQESGIKMSECRLLEENGCSHFMTKRFDRSDDGGKVPGGRLAPSESKIHMLSLGAMAHYDFNMPGAYSYEQAYDVLSRLGIGQDGAAELFRRMVFNVMARNQDDHVKNISFLMDRGGNWKLSPAYDITYANNPTNRWVGRHQMTVNGKRENITEDDMISCASRMNLRLPAARRILDEVQAGILQWETCAEKAGLPEKDMEIIKEEHYGRDKKI